MASEAMQFTSSDPPLVDHSMARDPVTVHYPLARVLAGGGGVGWEWFMCVVGGAGMWL